MEDKNPSTKIRIRIEEIALKLKESYVELNDVYNKICEVEKKLNVVQEQPTQSLKEVVVDDKVYECVTVEEALTEILEKVRELAKLKN